MRAALDSSLRSGCGQKFFLHRLALSKVTGSSLSPADRPSGRGLAKNDKNLPGNPGRDAEIGRKKRAARLFPQRAGSGSCDPDRRLPAVRPGRGGGGGWTNWTDTFLRAGQLRILRGSVSPSCPDTHTPPGTLSRLRASR